MVSGASEVEAVVAEPAVKEAAEVVPEPFVPTLQLPVPVDSANQLCDALQTLEQAAVAACCCEAACKDMVETVCCRAYHLYCLVRTVVNAIDFFHRNLSISYHSSAAQQWADKEVDYEDLPRTLDNTLYLATRSVQSATHEIYRCAAACGSSVVVCACVHVLASTNA